MSSQRGFTLVELGAVCVAGSIGAALVLAGTGARSAAPSANQPGPRTGERAVQPETKPVLPQGPSGAGSQNATTERERALAWQQKDAAQVRELHAALVIWGNQHNDEFPLPSKFDVKQTTVLGTSAAKDTTANIFSILIYTGLISTEKCVSPAEVNESIKVLQTYEFDRPRSAADPERALWDPAFGADFTGGKTGNISYAHLRPDAGRLGKWTSTFQTMEPVVGNRGPEIARIERNAEGKLVAKTALEKSKTFLIHGEPDKWEGNVAFADGHVEFLTDLLPDIDPESNKWPTYRRENKRVLDCLFLDEPDDVTRSNAFLGIFVSSPDLVKGTKPIWD